MAVAVAAGMEKRGLAKFRRIQTSYAQMEERLLQNVRKFSEFLNEIESCNKRMSSNARI